MFTPNIIPNKYTEKIKSDEKGPGKMLGIALYNFSLSIIFFFLTNTKYIASRVVKISAFSLVLRTFEKY